MPTLTERLLTVVNRHDEHEMSLLFAEDYRSVQPIHPGRGFGGRAQVLENWTAVFSGVPDFTAELLDHCVVGNTEWTEWSWHGHHVDGSEFAMRGVVITHVRDGLASDMRLYMEPVDTSGQDIAGAVKDLYQAPS